MTLSVASTFGSLPEAQVAFSSLASAGFNPVAAYNMNTPGSADGMAPSGYRVMLPEDEVVAARQFLAELRQAMASGATADADVDDDGGAPSTTLGRMRRLVGVLVVVVLVVWISMFVWVLLGRIA